MSVQHNFMRNANALSILHYIRTNGDSTRRELQSATGLSWAAVSTITAELIAQEILVEKTVAERVSGRNPNALGFNPEKNLSIGAEINVEGLTVTLLNLQGNVVDAQEELLTSADKNSVLNQLTRMIEEVMRKNNLQREQMLGIGISVQGSVDREGAVSLYNPYIADWKNVPLKTLFEDYFGIPAHVVHDPVCIGLAEQWERKYLENEDFVLIRLAFGIGMCYFYNGKPIHGHEGTAGEFGHMVVNSDGQRCSCGNQGCLEAYCSIRGIARRIYEATVPEVDRAERPFIDGDILYMKDLIVRGAEKANRGNQIMRSIFDDAGRYLGIGVANLINLINPKYIILTGGVLDASDLIVEQTRDYAQTHSWHLSSFELIVSKESCRRASMGAALHIINRAFENQESALLKRN